MSSKENVEGTQEVNNVSTKHAPEPPSTMSSQTSGYESLEGAHVPSELQGYNHHLLPLQVMPNYSPMLVHPSVGGRGGTSYLPLLQTNAVHSNHLVSQNPSLPLAHPYTAPVLVSTGDQFQLSHVQQMAMSSSQDQATLPPPSFRQCQYSGPVVVATPTNYDQVPVPLPSRSQPIPNSGDESPPKIQHTKVPVVTEAFDLPMSYRVYQSPQNSSKMVTPVSANGLPGRSASLVTQSLQVSSKKETEPSMLRRNTEPSISLADNKRKERIPLSVKKSKSLFEEGKVEHMQLHGTIHMQATFC